MFNRSAEERISGGWLAAELKVRGSWWWVQMVLAGLGDAWIRFLGARDSARLAPRHSQRTPFNPLPSSSSSSFLSPSSSPLSPRFHSLPQPPSWNLDAPTYLPALTYHVSNHGRHAYDHHCTRGMLVDTIG